jgi:hypothetical protein
MNRNDHVRNEDVLDTVEEEMNILRTIIEGRVTGFVKSCLGSALYSTLLKVR